MRIIVRIIFGIPAEEVFSVGSVFDRLKTKGICLESCFAPPRTFAVLGFGNPQETLEEILGFEMILVVFSGGRVSEGTDLGLKASHQPVLCW